MPVTSNNPVITSNPVMTSTAPGNGFDPSQLADIHLPQAISFWPIAPGWWFTLGVVIIALTAFWLWKKQHERDPAVLEQRRLKRLKSEAQQELEKLKQQYKAQQNAHKSIEALSVFLRRFALSVYPREQVASLTDEQWLKLLERLSGTEDFSGCFKNLLLEAPYQAPDKTIDTQLLEQLFAAAETLLAKTVQQKLSAQKDSGGQHV